MAGGAASASGERPGDPVGDAAADYGRSYAQTVKSGPAPTARNGGTPGPDVRTTVHELGHHLDLAHRRNAVPGQPNGYQAMGWINDKLGTLGDGTFDVGLQMTISDTVSSYATTNEREFLAECYTEGMLADRPPSDPPDSSPSCSTTNLLPLVTWRRRCCNGTSRSRCTTGARRVRGYPHPHPEGGWLSYMKSGMAGT